MIRTDKTVIKCFHRICADIGGNNKSVDQIKLEAFCGSAGKRTVQGSAGGNPVVHEQGEIIAESFGINHTGLPHAFINRISALVYIGEALVEISAGNHIVAPGIFRLHQRDQLPGLSFLALSGIIGFQVQVNEYQFLIRILNGEAADQKTPFQKTGVQILHSYRDYIKIIPSIMLIEI